MAKPTPSPEWDILLSAAQKNWPDRIREMIVSDGVNPSHSNAVGQTALHIASLWGNGTSSLKVCRKKLFEMELYSLPILCADVSSLYEPVESVRVLIELGADINAQNNLTGASPLHMVAQSHKASNDARMQVIELLLNGGALPDQADKYGSTPANLVEAANDGKELNDETKLLIARLQPRQPQIHQAILDLDKSSLEKLLSDSSDVNTIYRSETPLALAICRLIESVVTSETHNASGDGTETLVSMINMLLLKGADPNCILAHAMDDSDDGTKEPAMHKLVCALRKVYRVTDKDKSTEHTSKAVVLCRVIDLFLASGSIVPHNTTLLLHEAARSNECVFATFLIEHLSIDPNKKGRQGMTPLHIAARSGKVEMIVSIFDLLFNSVFALFGLLII
jgi:ankyrin repeat protein